MSASTAPTVRSSTDGRMADMALTVRPRDVPKIPGAVKVVPRLRVHHRCAAPGPRGRGHHQVHAAAARDAARQRPVLRPERYGRRSPRHVQPLDRDPHRARLAYVLYLFTDFRLWSIMRWRPSRFLLIASAASSVHVLRRRAPHAAEGHGHLPRADRCPAAREERSVSETDQRPVLVVDFGAQYAQLIARRVREANVYSEIVPHSITADEVKAKDPSAIVLSGGPSSVYEEGARRSTATSSTSASRCSASATASRPWRPRSAVRSPDRSARVRRDRRQP